MVDEITTTIQTIIIRDDDNSCYNLDLPLQTNLTMTGLTVSGWLRCWWWVPGSTRCCSPGLCSRSVATSRSLNCSRGPELNSSTSWGHRTWAGYIGHIDENCQPTANLSRNLQVVLQAELLQAGHSHPGVSGEDDPLVQLPRPSPAQHSIATLSTA